MMFLAATANSVSNDYQVDIAVSVCRAGARNIVTSTIKSGGLSCIATIPEARNVKNSR